MLQVASEDIVNNTGITLANPTGVAGTYALDFKASSIESSVASVFCGGSATLVITSTGEVRGWGYNLTGGINPNASPLQAYYNGQDTVVISGVKQLACGSAGSLYTMALLNNGDLVGWGANPYHNVNPDSATSPWLDETYVILSGVAKVSCGQAHTMVVMTDGTLRGWGSNSSRQVNPTSATNPWTDKTAVILSNVADVSCGGEHTMVLMEDGTVRAWGRNSEKQSNPLSTAKLWTDVNNIVVSNAKKIAAGAYQSYVIKNDDTLVDWGTNYYKSCNPQSALDPWVDPTITILSDVKDVSGVQQGVIVLHNNGDVVGFGGNFSREIYPYSSTHPWTDKTAVIISGVSKLVKGYTRNSIVVLSDGSVRGWGSNDYNNLKADSSVNPWTDPTIELYNVGVPSATLSWGGGTAQSVTEDGVYTLSDGSNNQKLILNFDGAEGATTYINDVTGEAIEPPLLQQESCSIDTSWKKFGVGSLKVTAGGYLYVEGLSPNTGDITLHSVLKVVQELSVGTSPFYIELTSTVTGDILCFFRFNFDSEGPLGGGAICYFSYYDYANETYHDSDYFEGLAVGSDSHIAMVIDGATVRGFVDGTNVWEYTHTGLITGFDIFDLRLVDGGQVNIDAVEITHEALWAENFTPPTSAPSAESGNTIEATVDYSALSAEDEVDNVRVFEELLSISVNPPSKYIRPGDALQYSVIGNYELGVTRDITSQVTDWESSDTSIATMLSSGIAKAVATGKTTIKAVLGALSDTVLLMVRSVLPRPPQIVAFSSQKAYRSAEYLTKRFKFPKTSLSLVKVIASAYPVELDVVYPKLSKTLTVVVTSKRPKRIKSFLVDCCEVRIRTNSQVSAVFLASSMDELPL